MLSSPQVKKPLGWMGASLFLLSRGWSWSCHLYQEIREMFAKVGEMASPERPLGVAASRHTPSSRGDICALSTIVC